MQIAFSQILHNKLSKNDLHGGVHGADRRPNDRPALRDKLCPTCHHQVLSGLPETKFFRISSRCYKTF